MNRKKIILLLLMIGDFLSVLYCMQKQSLQIPEIIVTEGTGTSTEIDWHNPQRSPQSSGDIDERFNVQKPPIHQADKESLLSKNLVAVVISRNSEEPLVDTRPQSDDEEHQPLEKKALLQPNLIRNQSNDDHSCIYWLGCLFCCNNQDDFGYREIN